MAIDPGTLKVIVQAAAKVVTDKETRNKILYVLLGSLAGLVVIIMIPIYLLTHPFETIKMVLGNDHVDEVQIEDFKQENDDKVLVIDENIIWYEGALYPLPLNGTVTSSYGERDDPFGGDQKTFHNGIDIQGVWHANIISIADGVIEKIDMTEGNGNSILIKHKEADGKVFYSYYLHLSKIYMFEGQSVKQGAVIGLEGGDPDLDPNPGRTTGHHLHFEIRTPGPNDKVDPSDYIFKIEDEPESSDTESETQNE